MNRQSTSLTLVDQLVEGLRKKMDDDVLAVGAKMPSIRQFAMEKKVSRFTVVEAYERLVALGYLEARLRSGFYVKKRQIVREHKEKNQHHPTLDLSWLLRNTLRTVPSEQGPGLGYLPASWLNNGLIRSSLKMVALQNELNFLNAGTPQGFLPLRQQLVLHLAERAIDVHPDQIILLSGVTGSIDLLANFFVRPGDAVIVGQPAWFQMFGRFAAQGAQLITMAYTPQGIDLSQLEVTIQEKKPKLLIINSILQNPTGISLSLEEAQVLLKLANQYDFLIVEDDVCADFLGSQQSAFRRLASLDQLQRVIYLGSFSKTLSANLRVGWIACAPQWIEKLTEQKMLNGLATPELNERVLYRILTDGHYRRHLKHLRVLLDKARHYTLAQCHRLQLKVFFEPQAGMFLWVDLGVDSEELAAHSYELGFLFAPGRLFLYQQQKSTWTRLNVANCLNPAVWSFLSDYLKK